MVISIKLPLIYLFSAGRKEDETDDKWMEKERERAEKEREREERGKKTQMWVFFFFSYITPTLHNHARLHTVL